jgi:predicted helicase
MRGAFMSIPAFQEYLVKIDAEYRRGNATELTYRSALENLIESLSPGVNASSDPRHIACGAPDFVVERHKIPLGYVETKDLGVNLDKIEKTDQLKRYFKALNNLILTDYLEFRWYVRGELRLKGRIAEAGTGNRLRPDDQGLPLIQEMFSLFFQTESPTVTSAKELATRMAEQTHLVRDLIINALKYSEEAEHAALEKQYKTFREFLLPELKVEEFADLYAQTMAYGLFAAKLSAPENAPFNRAAAYQYLAANKFLRRLFLDVGEELDGTVIAPFLDDIASLLSHADLTKIQADLFNRTRSEDPVVHFYETFLAVYDPKLRASRGVYYTPEPVVQFIVRSVDWLLKNRFDRPWGLADATVKILDPATGTATFLYYVIQFIYEEVTRRGQIGAWPEKSKELLGRVFGFELLMAPYVVSHLKLNLLLQELDAPLTKNERLQIYLTNTLEQGVTRAETLEGLDYYIADEASQAARVKKLEDIMVVIGNPPYSNFGMLNKNEWISGLLEDYKRGLHERKINLDDDFIKFIRFGQWRIEKTGQGILGFITNNTYIDGITHRRMRQSLLETFDEIYILDLHGSTRKKETTPEGSKDENVFDIQQGVAILLAIKNPNPKDLKRPLESQALVNHASLWGLREEKYTFLQSSDVGQMQWIELQPQAPDFFFVRNETHYEEYSTYPSLNDMFLESLSGVQTKKDELFVDYSVKELEDKMRSFIDNVKRSNKTEIELVLGTSENWIVDKARRVKYSRENIQPYMVQPFDWRYVYYEPALLGRARYSVMKHMLQDNIGLVFMRQSSSQDTYDHFLSTKYLITDRVFYSAHGAPFLSPLYVYTTPEDTVGTLFAQSETTRKANLNPAFVKELAGKLNMQFVDDGKGNLKTTFGPEDIFDYAYAVFHSHIYRQRYAEFLKIDFPRLPLTSDKKLFVKLAAKGEELVSLHLLRNGKVDDFITTFPIMGNTLVERVIQSPDSDRKGMVRVWINQVQYFGRVPEDVWEFKIGGYQVCEKWLKDRKGRILSGEDIVHYQKVVVSLKETIRLMKEIDKTIVKWPIE